MSDELPVPAINGGPNLASEPSAGYRDEPFSWLQPHPTFIIVLVGPEEKPFGIQKDFLCARSTYYRDYFKQLERTTSDTVEHIVKLPHTTAEVFGLTQLFLFTGQVSEEVDTFPSYEALIGVWKLGHKLGIDGLCDKTLEAMKECRRITRQIPATPLLVQVWRDTPEGSTIRKLLLSWAAEYMRSSDARAEFAKSLPQEVLSELVVTMSSLENQPSPPAAPADTVSAEPTPRKSVHYLEEDSSEEREHLSKKNRRASAPLPASQNNNSKSVTRAPPPPVRKAAAVAAAAAATAPRPKPVVQKRRSIVPVSDGEITTEKKVEFCADLLDRMLSGPGFWTRLVGPFKEPVDPVEDGVPDYFNKVKKPMDLNTVKAKMSRHEYRTEDEFASDVRQIFENCYTYWTKGDPMWAACEKFQKTFEEKYAQMHKNISKMMREPVD
ncbi:Putative bromodomain, SKP1/BTB/POZ domain superfamily, Bromodomain-like superfamily protein [Colletotrichum destructivum]|uniref:Bromodomain, SKP1/BTB/POZ domain superfamily, Bromodomain-like superfamily protein n=1 Tax=Colletotrichum destructivum TaxID=34406 RepID=A0AAX4IJS7_9PEZI|nr:Putative bromodomain, SKP1/BTB/POZ domain superfamily, Bromodomain-like superfamily protein [Colletotrichum destructivum]